MFLLGVNPIPPIPLLTPLLPNIKILQWIKNATKKPQRD